MMEYSLILEKLEKGEIKEVKHLTKVWIKEVVKDAKLRLEVAD